MNHRVEILFACLSLLVLNLNAASNSDLPSDVRGFLKNNCIQCHKKSKQKGKIRLDNYTQLSQKGQIDLLNKVEEQLFIEQMPPKDEDQPTAKERVHFSTWIDKQYLVHKTKSRFKVGQNKSTDGFTGFGASVFIETRVDRDLVAPVRSQGALSGIPRSTSLAA